MRTLQTLVFLFCLTLYPIHTGTAGQTAPTIAGWTEHVLVQTPDDATSVIIDAKLDTGAKTSSLHAIDISHDEEHNTVHFTYVTKDGKHIPMACPLVRWVRIKRRPEGFHRRPVVGVRLRIGARVLDTEVNLTDRSHFKYRLLIGRTDLKQGFLIDSSKQNILHLPSTGK